MPRIPNPYFAGPPATQPDTFFGRQDVLRFVDETLASPMHRVIVFHGQRRIGKTSILHQIRNRSGQEYQAVFFDLQSNIASPAHDLFYELAREVADQLNVPVPDRIDFQRDLDTFRTIFLPQVYKQLGNRHLLLLLDEFDALSLQANPAELDRLPFVNALNRIIQSDDKRVVFLFVIGRQLKDLTSQQLQIFRVARHQQITLLRREDALQLITQPAQGVLHYQEAASERIWQLTNGHPYFTQLLCQEIFNQAQRQNNWTVTETQVEAVIDDAISVGQSALQWFWDEVSPVERFTLYTIGQLEAEMGYATLDQLSTQRSLQGIQVTDFELRDLPDQLVSREVLKRDLSECYRFAVELVRRWIVQAHSLEEVTTKLTRLAVDEKAKTFFKAGQQAYWGDDIELAVKNFSRALSINANYVEARLWLARAYARMGDLLTAINEFVNVERFGGPTQREAHFGLTDVRSRYGQQLEEEGKIEEAIQEYQRVLELDSEHPMANVRLSQIFRDEADHHLANEGLVAAQSLYEQALRHDSNPDLERAIKERLEQYGQAQEAANNWEEAERASRLAVTLTSKTVENQEALLRVQLNWARWHLSHHELDTAARVYKRLLTENSDDSPRQMIENDILRYSQQQEEQNNWVQAETALRLLVELSPGNPENHNRLADSLCRQGEFFLDQADMVNAKAAYQRALLSASLNQPIISSIQAGFQSYHRARSEDKTVHTQKLAEAAMLILTELLGQSDSVAYQWLAEVRTNLGDALRAEHQPREAQAIYQQAVDDITHVLQLVPDRGPAYHQRALLWLKLGQVDLNRTRFEEAVEHFQRALVDAGPDQESFVDQIKRMFNDYRRHQEEVRRWNYAERALEILGRLFSEDEEARFWLAEMRLAWAKWHLQRSLPDLDEVQRLARRALDVNLSRTKFHIIIAWIKETFQSYCLQQEQASPPNWAQAEQIMNNLVILLPDDPAIHRRLVETRANQGDWYLAYECQSLLEAQFYLLKAAEVYGRALNDAPNDHSLVTRLKRSFRVYQHRQYGATPPAWPLAEQALQILADLLPRDEEARQWQAIEALALQATRLLHREPADLAEARRDLAEAGKIYEEALQKMTGDKTALIAHLQASFRLYRQKHEQTAPPNWDLAEESLVMLAALLPEEAETRAQQAEFYMTQADCLLQQEPADLVKVEALYQQALAELPGSRETLAPYLQQQFRNYRLKQQQRNPPDWPVAEQALNILAALLPGDGETQRQLTEMYAECGHWHLHFETAETEQAETALSEAGRFYRKAIETLTGDKTNLLVQIKEGFNACRLKHMEGVSPQWPLAERAVTILAELLPDDEEVQSWLAEVCLAQGRYYGMEAQFISDRRRETEQAQKFEEAAQAYERAILAAERRTHLAPLNPSAWQQLVTTQAGLGQLCQTFRDEQGALNTYDSALGNWRKALDLGADAALVKEVAMIHLARGDILLQRGDLTAAEQDYLAANELSPHDRAWLAEVDQRLQTYQARQKPLGIQRQVVAAGELRYRLQPDNLAVWRGLASELVIYGGEFLEDDQFELARQRYEQALSPWTKTPDLDEAEHHRLSQIIHQDVGTFIQRQEQAGNRPQAEEARAWLANASFLTKKAVASPQPGRYAWWWWPTMALAAALLCVGAAFSFGPLVSSFMTQQPSPTAMLISAVTPSATPIPSATATAVAISTATPLPPSPTATPLPPAATASPTFTPAPAVSPTATVTPSPTSTPTMTETATATPTALTPSSTPVPTSNLGPALLSPADGIVFSGANPLPRLEWSPIADLAPDQRYVIKLQFLEQGQLTLYPRRWLQDTSWEVPAEIFQRADPPERLIQWEVVVAQISPAGEIVQELGAPSETRTFSWQPIPLPPGEGLEVAINPGNTSQILVILRGVGIYKSDNDGIDWRRVSNEPALETLHFAPANPEIVYAGAFAQVLKSENGGETWQAYALSLTAQVYAVVTDPDNARLVFVATDRGVLGSDDGGQTWVGLDQAGNQGGEILNRPFYSMVTARTTSQGSRVYAGGNGDQIYWRGTDDLSSPWQRQVCRNVCTPPISALALNPQGNRLVAGSDRGKLAISLNAGADWNSATIPSMIPTLKFSAIEFDPTNPDLVYGGSGTHRYPGDGEGLYRSLDGGLTWHRFNNWNSGEGMGTYVQGIAINPQDGQIIFIAGSEGVFRSADGGDSWKKQ